MTADRLGNSNITQTAHLPATVVAELELNSVIPTAGHERRGETK